MTYNYMKQHRWISHIHITYYYIVHSYYMWNLMLNKRSQAKEEILWFYVYKIQEEAKLIYGYRRQNNGYLWERWVVSRWDKNQASGMCVTFYFLIWFEFWLNKYAHFIKLMKTHTLLFVLLEMYVILSKPYDIPFYQQIHHKLKYQVNTF